MIAQLTGCLAYSVCFITLGSLAKKVVGWNLSCFHDFLIGLALTNALFTLISLGYPINNMVASLFLTGVLLLLLFNLAYERAYFRYVVSQFRACRQKSPALFFLLAIIIPITFFQSLYSPSLHYDSGLYHVPSIKWTAEYRTIRGLVHLNSFLGYNFNIFSLDAAFYTVFQQPIYPINFTIISFFGVWITVKLSDLVRANYYLLASVYLLIFYYLILNFWPHVSTPSVDTLVFMLSIVLFSSATDLRKSKDVVFFIPILAVYAITIKLSSAPVLLLALYVLVTKHYWRQTKPAIYTGIVCGFILIPWLIKNVLLTGWLLFPFPSLNVFSFDWQLPIQDVISLKADIKNFYMPAESSPLHTVQAWFSSQTGIDLCIILLTLLSVATLVIRLLTRKLSLSTDDLTTLTAAVSGVLFMYLNSPSLRYGVAFFLAAILVSVKAFKINGNAYVFYLFGLFVFVTFLKNNWFHPWHFTKHIAHRFLLPYPLVLTEPNEFAYFLIDKDTKCYYPLESNQCFEHSLPCASRKINGLHLRGKGIEQGFYRDAQ